MIEDLGRVPHPLRSLRRVGILRIPLPLRSNIHLVFEGLGCCRRLHFPISNRFSGKPNYALPHPKILPTRSRYLSVLMSLFSALRMLAFDQERSLHCGRDDGRCKGYEEKIQGNDPRFQ